MAVYTVFDSVNMGTTHFAERIFDAVSDVDVENGTFGYLEELADGYSHIYNFKVGTKEGADIVVVDNPAWSTDECRITNQRRDKYIVEAGTPFRVRTVKERDEFGISAEGFTPATRQSVIDVKDFKETPMYLTIDASTGKLVASASSTEGAVMEAKIKRSRVSGGALSTPIRSYGFARKMYEAKVTTLA